MLLLFFWKKLTCQDLFLCTDGNGIGELTNENRVSNLYFRGSEEAKDKGGS